MKSHLRAFVALFAYVNALEAQVPILEDQIGNKAKPITFEIKQKHFK
jgi:hypothetical protein